MKRTSLITFFLILFNLIPFIQAQVIFEPLDNPVYSFLDRLSLKNIISINNEQKPFSRKQIASYLGQANNHINELNYIERDELDFYKEEYSYELGIEAKRWRLFQYEDSLFQFKLSPILRYEISSTGNKSGFARNWGARVFTSYGKNFSASIQMTDNGEFGDNVDQEKFLTPAKGASTISVENGIEYSDVRGSIGNDFNWGSITLKKDYYEWGYASFGSLVLSNKAPSYPHIYFEMNPVPWFRFYYVHGWLNSQVIDSVGFVGGDYTYPTDLQKFIPKYLVANMFAFTPIQNLDLFIGNSIIYKGDLRAEFFIPFLFFKYLDRDVGKGSIEDGNGQLYFGVNVKMPSKTKFYSSIFLDVTEIRNILKQDFSNTWLGYTVGCKRIDALIDNLDIVLEYTRTNPWVYEHKSEVTTYKHLGYSLGHWIGTNADHLKLQVNYQFIRGLITAFSVERVRKGGLADISSIYLNSGTSPFLYGPLRKDLIIGLNAQYEFFHEAFVHFKYQYSNISDEDKNRTPSFMIGKKNSFNLALQYGLP